MDDINHLAYVVIMANAQRLVCLLPHTDRDQKLEKDVLDVFGEMSFFIQISWMIV